MRSRPITMRSPRTSPFVDRAGSAHPSRRLRRGGFTLVEILVATVVLVLIVGMMSSMLSTMEQNWRDAQKRVNNSTKARAMLDMMAHDVQAGIFRSDLPAFPAGTLGFYTLRPGISSPAPATSDIRYVSAVTYSFATSPSDISMLQRSDLAVLFDNSSSLSFGPNATFPTGEIARDTAPGIIDFKFVFIQQDGTITTTYNAPGSINPSRAVGITLAVVDDQTMQALSSSQVTTLRADLEGAVPATITDSVKTTWEQYLNTTLVWKSYPQSLGTGFTIFERYVVLPSS